MAKTGLTVRVEIAGLRETLAKLNTLPKAANDAIKDHSQQLAGYLARRAQGRARGDRSPQAKRVAQTIKVMRDRVPVIQAGGTQRIASSRVPAYKLLFGSEFGSNQLGQFGKRHNGQQGSWFYGTVEDHAAEIADALSEAADETIEHFTKGGG